MGLIGSLTAELIAIGKKAQLYRSVKKWLQFHKVVITFWYWRARQELHTHEIRFITQKSK